MVFHSDSRHAAGVRLFSSNSDYSIGCTSRCDKHYHKNMMQLLDAVTLLEDKPEKNLTRGQVGTIVEVLAEGVFEVEFADDEGRTQALVALPAAVLAVVSDMTDDAEDLLELRRAEAEAEEGSVSLEDVKKQLGIS